MGSSSLLLRVGPPKVKDHKSYKSFHICSMRPIGVLVKYEKYWTIYFNA